MNILWIGSIAWSNDDKFDWPVDGAGAISGSLFEKNMICGLEENGCNVNIINSYPYLVKEKRNGYEWHHNSSSIDFCIGTKKNKYSNLLYEKKALIRYLKTIDLFKFDAVIVYLVHTPYLCAIKYVKKINKKIKTILICPDLANMMDLGSNIVKKIAKKFELVLQKKLHYYVDKYVLFSDYMVEKLPLGHKPYIVIEGVNSIDKIDFLSKDSNKYIIMYAGSLQKNFGLENLLDAFMGLSLKNIELHIYGNGVLDTYIKRQSLIDKRIKFFGFVNHQIVLNAEKTADLLVNVRNPNESFTKYSFPSKTFEYMMSGTPFLTTRLKGIPNEYYNFLYVIDDNEVSTIKKAIENIYNTNTKLINKKIIEGVEFLLNKKNRVVQSRKLISFIKG